MEQERDTQNTGKKHLELLAPAGSFAACRAVIHAGADAVYLGGSHFSARAYAENLTQDELLQAIDYGHLHGRKIYLAVNTLLKQAEQDLLYRYLLPYYEQGLDAAIIQDPAVLQQICTWFPDLPVHVSTQMSVSSVHGAAYLKERGAARIVLARELSLEEISAIHSQTNVELECFVHGALCYSYSGQCLFSSILGARSGNRGRCAQPCRLPYTVLDEDRHRISGQECYPLSLKDLCTVDQIPQLAQAGITSFKIEGRMKSAEYAAGVTAIYRNYIDAYLADGAVSVRWEDLRRLYDTGNRSGFTDGYYHRRNGREMVTLERPGHEKGDERFFKALRAQYVDTEKKIKVHARAVFKTGKPAALSIAAADGTCGQASCGIVQAAKNQPMSREMLAAQLSKTGNTPFVMESVDITMDGSVFMPKQALNELRRKAVEDLTGQMLSMARRPAGSSSISIYPDKKTAQPMPGAEHGPQHQRPQDDIPPFYAAVSSESQFAAVLDSDLIRRIYLDSAMYPHAQFATQLRQHVARARDAKKQAYLILPAIFRQAAAQFYRAQWGALEGTGINGYLVRNQDELGFLKAQQIEKDRCVLDQGIYTFSDDAKNWYTADGWKFDTIPYELNKKELLARDDHLSELILYGRIPLMVSAQCLQKTLGRCKKTDSLCYLKDRYAKEFPVRANCSECYNIVYNALPLSLIQVSGELKKLPVAAYRLHFTLETPEEIHRILDCCRQSFFQNKIPDIEAAIGPYTNGHYKRGVE